MTTDERIILYERYLQMKVEEKDWHGVMDAAADLRELEVAKRMGRSTLREIGDRLYYLRDVWKDLEKKARKKKR